MTEADEFEYDFETCDGWYQEQERLKKHLKVLGEQGLSALNPQPLPCLGNPEEALAQVKSQTICKIHEYERLLSLCTQAFWDRFSG